MAARVANNKVQPHALEDFIGKGKPLPSEAMARLVEELFHKKARWDAETETIADVVKPAFSFARSKAACYPP